MNNAKGAEWGRYIPAERGPELTSLHDNITDGPPEIRRAARKPGTASV